MCDVPHTEEEALQLLALRNEFWHKLGELVAQTLAKMPTEFHDDQLMAMQDLASLYGSNYDEHLAKLAPPKREGWAPPKMCAAKAYGLLQNAWKCDRCEMIWPMASFATASKKCKANQPKGDGDGR